MKRYRLRNKDVRELIRDFMEAYEIKSNSHVFSKSKGNVDCVNVDNMKLYLIDDLPLIIKIEERFFPTLIFDDILENLPYVIVDVGAVAYICKGADVMLPGIKRMEGEIKQGGTVSIYDEKYKKRIAVGKSLYDIEEIRNMKKGKVIENIHYIGDKFWRLILVSKEAHALR